VKGFLAFSTYNGGGLRLPCCRYCTDVATAPATTPVTGGEVNGLLRVGEAHFMPWKKREFK